MFSVNLPFFGNAKNCFGGARVKLLLFINGAFAIMRQISGANHLSVPEN
jgi:hypothetical protein